MTTRLAVSTPYCTVSCRRAPSTALTLSSRPVASLTRRQVHRRARAGGRRRRRRPCASPQGRQRRHRCRCAGKCAAASTHSFVFCHNNNETCAKNRRRGPKSVTRRANKVCCHYLCCLAAWPTSLDAVSAAIFPPRPRVCTATHAVETARAVETSSRGTQASFPSRQPRPRVFFPPGGPSVHSSP